MFQKEKLIRFQHCDPAGIVFYPQYLVLFHELMEDWFNEGLEGDYAEFVLQRRMGLPIVKLECEFLTPNTMGNILAMRLQVRQIGTSSVTLEVSASTDGRECVRATLKVETRKWARRYFGKMKKMPSSFQAADYSAVTQYLSAVKMAGTDSPEKILAYLKSAKINDMYVKNGYIRPDGRMMNNMYLMQVKDPAESKYPWDYYKVIEAIPSEKIYTTKAESKCALWK